ncbi:glycoside hydrolase family 3 C-terminal domain-containing protein [Paenarthrobacter nitroguajacolicus]|uniref:glycoside hydrolase family 3 C-terminal domain-containing protein n=1 Tax=Paenarthrobacter nitroguajacolicus TaxID=211146 RepID=UPI001AE8538E|nr:glycoside hydrolase family 3 C-terminal domain-containing protein [Paenarthrobacter nitroguajacolicus]MDR6639508.1 beta-glucosidase [Paenarthrobacter nitroguajacolicus]
MIAPAPSSEKNEVVTKVVKDLRLEDKTALLSGRDFWSTAEVNGVPSMVLTDGPHGVRRQAGEADNLGIHGSLPATCFPPGTALGSSWDQELAEEVGQALGREARHLGVNVLLGPAVNIKRSPLCGRNFEYFSEDPLISGVLGAAWVRGVQSQGVGTSVKHFAANNQETDRMRISSDVDERTLREIYFPAFERVVQESKPTAVMCSYNRINGTYASENTWLLTDVLRKEWGFTGAVLSDWGAVSNRVAALKAGLDLEMPGSDGTTTAEIISAVKDGSLDTSFVDASAIRVAALQQLTAFEGGDTSAFDVDAHHALARRAAGGSIVLLRNENGTLPLQPGTRVAVLGEFAEKPRYQGGGSSHINPTRIDIPLEELRKNLGEDHVHYAPGYGVTGTEASSLLLEEATDLARRADVSIVFVGLDEKEESEGFDRTNLDLPADHVALIEAVAAVSNRTVVVLSNGGVVTLEPWHDDVDAILEGWALGQAGGGALADVLTGRTNPSGRLAETIPFRLNDTASFINFPGEAGHVRYGEGALVGYRYHETVDVPARYPFGHGLSYTTFTYSDLSVDVPGTDHATVHLTVTNAGDRAGADVVQIYVAAPKGPVRKPLRELRAFQKVTLEPGESRTLAFELDRRAFAHYDITDSRWAVTPGEYSIELGRSSHDIAARSAISLEGDAGRTAPLSLTSTVEEWFTHPVAGPLLIEGMTASMTEEQREAAEAMQDGLKMVYSMPMDQFAKFPGVTIPQEALEQLIHATREAPVG